MPSATNSRRDSLPRRKGPMRWVHPIGKNWVHPCPAHGTWVMGNELMHQGGISCRRSYKWRKDAMLWMALHYLLSPGDKAYLRRIEREVQRDFRSSIFLPEVE